MLQWHIAPYSNLDLQADYKIGRKLHSREFIALKVQNSKCKCTLEIDWSQNLILVHKNTSTCK